MYEMRAGPATTGSPGLVWHVLAKDDARTTLCGRQLTHAVRPRPIHDDAPTERYCSTCMTAFRETMETAAR